LNLNWIDLYIKYILKSTNDKAHERPLIIR
jgi:hypothetical protein